jgi:hypothetical protein
MPLAQVRGLFFGVPVGCHVGRRGNVCPQSLLLFVLLLVPFADASSPDPLWVRGVYDAADLDEIVIAVSSLAGVVKNLPLSVEKPIYIRSSPRSVAGPLFMRFAQSRGCSSRTESGSDFTLLR